jgi:chromosome segregation ATPase
MNASLTKDKEHLESSYLSLGSQLEESHSELSKITKKFEDMKEELSRPKNLNASMLDNDDSRSEVMSTSTVSRVEESNRMRDVEDSFEDRYSKLKLIAIKLKKKVVDQEKIIKDLQARSSKTQKTEECDSGLKEKIASLNKNFNSLQSQYDAAVDKLETVEAEAKTLRKDLEASLSECLASKQKSEESIQQALSAKTELTKMEGKAREAEGKVHSLEITIEEERKERKLLESNAKKTGEQAVQLKDIMDEKLLIEDTVQSLKLQVLQLEETLLKEQERADHAHKNLTITRTQLTQTEADLARQKIETDELNKKYEDTVRATEVLQEQVGDVIKNSEKEQGQEKNKVLQLERQVSALEANLTAKSQSLDFKENEYMKVSKEFENYKLRAQSVLKQSKDKASEEETKKKQDDLFAMEKMNDALNDKIKSMSLEIRTISMERNVLQDEHDRLMERFSLLLQELGTKEKSWREKAEQQETRIRQVENEKTGNLERVHKTMENLKQIHQQEVETLKNATLAEMSKLKQQIDLKENEVIRLELILQKEQESRRQAEERAGQSRGVGSVFDNRLDICQIEREACEGQEVDSSSVPSPSTSMASPLPLEQLLAQDTVAEDLRSTSSSRAGGADRQVSHLAALLSESEAQNSRLEKLTEVLKEEIRTYQRSEERHKHIENLEYVKNVILKFLTLTGAQERARLIPVLQTILKLKKEEVAKIEELVRADEGAQSAGEGWGSYLWS